MGFTVDYEDRRIRSMPQGLFLLGLTIALVALTAGIWWILPVAAICFVPAMTPPRVIGRLFPDDEEWVARAKLGFWVMGVVFVVAFAASIWVIYLADDPVFDVQAGSRPLAGEPSSGIAVDLSMVILSVPRRSARFSRSPPSSRSDSSSISATPGTPAHRPR